MRSPIDQRHYANNVVLARRAVAKAMSDPKIASIVKQARAIKPEDWSLDHPVIKAASRAIFKAGVTTSTGFNFYDLRGPAYMLFPLNTPFVQMIPKKGAINAGVGTAAHWKATKNPNSTNVYVGVVEGARGGMGSPDEVDYLATYKELGMEGGNSFTSQYAGEGYTDNLADEHFRNLARLRLGEEMMTLLGNSGTAAGNLGLALGQPAQPTIALKTGGALSDTVHLSVSVVAISGMGLNPGGQGGYFSPYTVTGGLVTSQQMTQADGSKLTINGGVSQASAVSAVVTTGSSSNQAQAKVAAVKGAFAYAWFLNATDASAPTLSNCKLFAITNAPVVTINSVTVGTQTANATGLDSDHSYNATDFDGLLTYALKYGLWTDMAGGTLTPIGNGMVAEVESDLANLWETYQAQPDTIWCASDTRLALDQAIMYSSTGTNSYIFSIPGGPGQNALQGGFLVTGYKSKYSINAQGGAVIPIRLHPMLPPGTIYYDINQNPYPHSRIPAVRQFLTQRDYYSIEWPVTTRQWTYGTYIHEVLAHYMPQVSAIRTSVGAFVHP